MKPVDDGELEELASHCIRCGFCLEACPTFRLTGTETDSPRGRIYLARSAEEGNISWQDATESLDRCLGCRACEPACPSGVEYGRILELARNRIEHERPRRARKWLLWELTDPRKVRLLLDFAKSWPSRRMPSWINRLITRQHPEADLPRAVPSLSFPPLDESFVAGHVCGSVNVLEGCAMREMFPGVNEAVRRLLLRVGFLVLPSGGGCCGALHAHNGHLERATYLAKELEKTLSGGHPVVVPSAGCGAWMKDAGIQGVSDVSEFLLANGLESLLKKAPSFAARIAYHDACHLAHGQGIRDEPRRLLGAIPGSELVPLYEADTCCGSAGVYNVFEPKIARELLERKWANIEASGAEIVAMGNPGCHAWIRQAAAERKSRIKVLHTAEILEAALSGLDPETI